ncbi:MAG: glycosyltransferase family 2 protein [Patescibacteria group bacterium]|jgi:hypothetical protein
MISVIIVSYNTKDFLQKCLESLQKQQQVDYEIMVVDNNSSDNSVAMVRANFPQVKLIANMNNGGFAKAVNQGIQQAVGDYILLVNPDMIVPPEALFNMQTILQQQADIALLGARLTYPNGQTQASVGNFPAWLPNLATKLKLSKIFHYGRYYKPSYNKLTKVDWVSGGFLMFSKKLIDKIGWWDEKYFLYLEDVDFCKRAAQAGLAAAFTPAVSVLHYHMQSTKKKPQLANEAEKNSQAYYRLKYKT